MAQNRWTAHCRINRLPACAGQMARTRKMAQPVGPAGGGPSPVRIPQDPLVHRLRNHLDAGVPRGTHSTSKGLAVFHLPLVKSGNSTGALPPATDFSVSGEMALLVTES